MKRRVRQSQRPASSIEGEKGTIHKEAPTTVALGYPAPYSVGASSLGAQTVYRVFNRIPGLACTRFFAPNASEQNIAPLISVENGRLVSDSHVIAFSISCETELLGIISLLARLPIEPLARNRNDRDPLVIIGGPITYLDPRLVSSLADIVVVGESEDALPILGLELTSMRSKGEIIETLSRASSGIWIPRYQQLPPAPKPASIEALPAKAATWSSHAEFKNLFLVEATRGCKRKCSFCVLSSRSGGENDFRAVPVDRILQSIPMEAPGVGLVGAAVTDHPEIETLVRTIVDKGMRVSLSSIRADKLTQQLAIELKKGGLRTLTLAADGCSDQLRRSVRKGITEEHLLQAVGTAKTTGIGGIKIYTMVGLPGETDDDIASFCDLILKMAKSLRISVAAQAFVPKPRTPLEGVKMEDEAIISKRLKLMQKYIKGRAKIISTSPKWSRLDWKLAHSKDKAAEVAIWAYRGGGTFSAWRAGLEKVGIQYCD